MKILAAPSLAPGLPAQGLAGLVLGSGEDLIVNSCVGGNWFRPWPVPSRAEPSWTEVR